MQNFLYILLFLFYFCCRPTILRVFFIFQGLQTQLLTPNRKKKQKKTVFRCGKKTKKLWGKTVIKH